MNETKHSSVPSVAIAIATCNKYAFVLGPQFIMMDRYWPDRSLPIYLSSDCSLAPYQHIHNIKLIERSGDPGFLDSWVNLLREIPEDYVIVLQEDFIIERPVNQEVLDGIFHDLHCDPSIACVRLMPFPPGKGERITPSTVSYTTLIAEQDYSFSWQLAIWDRLVFIDFMEARIKRGIVKARKQGHKTIDYRKPKPKPDVYHYFNPEHHGSELFTQFPNKKFLCIYSELKMPESGQHAPISYRPTAVENGQVRRWAQKLFENERVPIKAPPNMLESRGAWLKRMIRNKARRLRTKLPF